MNRRTQIFICGAALGLTLWVSSVFAFQTRATQTVPFVGCKSDGQIGPLEAPPAGIQPQVERAAAGRLSLYMSQNGPAILGPRGWFCIGINGSGGSTLYVTPDPLRPELVLNSGWKGIQGPGIEVVVRSGDTAGRFQVAQIVARVFPAKRSYVEQIIAEGIAPASDFPFGSFPSDHLTSLNDRVVEFQTPSLARGLGTAYNLIPNSEPIRGVAILSGATPDLSMLMLRLPRNLDDLAPIILREFEGAHIVPSLDR